MNSLIAIYAENKFKQRLMNCAVGGTGWCRFKEIKSSYNEDFLIVYYHFYCFMVLSSIGFERASRAFYTDNFFTY
jgi:hypothetical protein